MYAMQLEAYRSAQNTSMNGRDIEAAALTRCALLLEDCQRNWGKEGHEERFSESIRFNQAVWSILQSELIKDDNPLPVDVRKNILTLSVFIDNRIMQVLAKPEPDKLNIIIDINLNLSAGLRGSGAE